MEWWGFECSFRKLFNFSPKQALIYGAIGAFQLAGWGALIDPSENYYFTRLTVNRSKNLIWLKTGHYCLFWGEIEWFSKTALMGPSHILLAGSKDRSRGTKTAVLQGILRSEVSKTSRNRGSVIGFLLSSFIATLLCHPETLILYHVSDSCKRTINPWLTIHVQKLWSVSGILLCWQIHKQVQDMMNWTKMRKAGTTERDF